MPDPAYSARGTPRDGLPLIAAVAAASLACNVLLAVWLWRTGHRQDARLARLEKVVRSARPTESTDAPPAPPRGATREERVAFLLAVAGNADESRRVLENIAAPECVEMFRALLARPAAGDRNAALDALCQHVAGSNPMRAAALLAEVPEATLRATLTAHVTNLWIEQNPDATAQWLDRSGENFLPREAFDAQLARAATRWAAYDPAGATRFLAARPSPGRETLAALANSSVEWGRKEPTAALAWVQNLSATDPRRFGMTQSILAGWAEREPARAAIYLQERLYDGGEGGELYYSTVGLIADRWASADPRGAAQWASTLASQRARRDATRRIAAAWATVDLPGASRWAGSLAADPARGAAWQAIVASWPGNDLDSEGTWLGSLPTTPDRDMPAALHAGKIAPTDPVKALVWAKTIGEATLYMRTINAILDGWERTDPAAARNWRAANNVDAPVYRR